VEDGVTELENESETVRLIVGVKLKAADALARSVTDLVRMGVPVKMALMDMEPEEEGHVETERETSAEELIELLEQKDVVKDGTNERVGMAESDTEKLR
jgi:hypothetical protein